MSDYTETYTIENIRSRMRSKSSIGLITSDFDQSVDPAFKDIEIQDIHSDSRRVSEGSLFVAIPGNRENGEDFVGDALNRGAKIIVTENSEINLKGKAAKLCVNDARRALSQIARRHNGSPDLDLDLIGVTGTNGKTTVTTLIRFLLEESAQPVGLIGTVRYHLGDRELPSFRTTPESSDIYPMLKSMLASGCSEAVMEVSSHGIHQHRVFGINFEVVVFLNLSRDHLDYHHDMETYFREKIKIFNGENGPLPKVAVINEDCPYGRRLIEQLPPQVRVLTFGTSERCDFRAREVEVGDNETKFILDSLAGTHVVTSPLIGSFNVFNLLAALAVVHAQGRSISDTLRKVSSFGGVDGRMETVSEENDFNVVVDYAHTPDALRNALSILRECTSGRLHVVFGCGGDRDQGKRMEMTRVACAGADQIWVTSDNPRTESLSDIFNDMRKGVSRGAKISFIEDRRRAISMSLDAAEPGDCILIAGKGHESFQEVQYSAIPFDDRKIARELLKIKKLSV